MAGGDEGRRDTPDEIRDMWDGVGRYLQGGGDAGRRIAERNLALWAGVSARLDEGGYGADALATDTVRAASVAWRNTMDLWSAAVRPPVTGDPAPTVPTVFLRFDYTDGYKSVAPPVTVPAPDEDVAGLPATAAVALAGGDAASAEAAAKMITARLDRRRCVYELVTVAPPPAKDAGAEELPQPGTYVGCVYQPDTSRVLANLQVVVTPLPWERPAAR